jgi:hypothetical protein
MIPNDVVPPLIDGPTLVSNETPTMGQAAPDAGGKTWQTLALDGLMLEPDMQQRALMSRRVIADYAALYGIMVPQRCRRSSSISTTATRGSLMASTGWPPPSKQA